MTVAIQALIVLGQGLTTWDAVKSSTAGRARDRRVLGRIVSLKEETPMPRSDQPVAICPPGRNLGSRSSSSVPFYSTGLIGYHCSAATPAQPRIWSVGDDELELIRMFLDRCRADGEAFLLLGQPGVGKTVLLDTAGAAASEAGILVLGKRGVEFEADVPYAGLHQDSCSRTARRLSGLIQLIERH